MIRLQVTIEPWDYPSGGIELRVQVTGVREYNYQVVIPQDDFLSLFDVTFEEARRVLHKAYTDAMETEKKKGRFKWP